MIRIYNEKDLNRVLEIWSDSSKKAHYFLTEEYLEKERHDIENIFLKSASTYLYLVDDRPAGFISLIGNIVGGLFVDPAYWNKGIGTKLLNYAVELMGDLELEVFKENERAVKFYEKYGFISVKEEIHYAAKRPVFFMRFEKPSE